MSERLPESAGPRTTNLPVEPVGDVARKNVRLALALTAIAALMVVGAVLISLVYLQYD
jgi:hypothetical protein